MPPAIYRGMNVFFPGYFPLLIRLTYAGKLFLIVQHDSFITCLCAAAEKAEVMISMVTTLKLFVAIKTSRQPVADLNLFSLLSIKSKLTFFILVTAFGYTNSSSFLKVNRSLKPPNLIFI